MMLAPKMLNSVAGQQLAGGVDAVGQAPSGAEPRIAVVFGAYSLNAQEREPVVLRRDRAGGAQTIGAAGWRDALLAGTTTIAALRRSLR